MGEDGVEDALDIVHHLVVPEAEDGVAARFQHNGAGGVVGLTIGVLAPVEFDDQAGRVANEVGDLAVDGRLTTELEAVELAVAESAPQFAFDVGLVAAEAAGDSGCNHVGSLTQPLSRGEREGPVRAANGRVRA